MTPNSKQDAEAQIRGLIERWATSVREPGVDGVLADHAEDMVMRAAVHNTVAPLPKVLAKLVLRFVNSYKVISASPCGTMVVVPQLAMTAWTKELIRDLRNALLDGPKV